MDTDDRVKHLEAKIEFLESMLDSLGPRLACLEQRVIDVDTGFTARLVKDLRDLESRGFRAGL